MTKEEIVQQLLDCLRGTTYLEIGSCCGGCLHRIKAKRKLAVEPYPSTRLLHRLGRRVHQRLRGVEERVFTMTSDSFFETQARLFEYNKIDIALVDGLHTYRQTLRDVQNCLQHLDANGIIVMHDCSPGSATAAQPGTSWTAVEEMQLPDWTGEWCGDVWKTIVHLRALRCDLCVCVLDCDYGVGLVTKGKPESRLHYAAEEIKRLTYADLEKNRQTLLNLKKSEYLIPFLTRQNAF